MIVLAREGVDSFVSRVVFFCIIFGACLVLAKLLYWLFDTAGLIKARVTRTRALASPPRANGLCKGNENDGSKDFGAAV